MSESMGNAEELSPTDTVVTREVIGLRAALRGETENALNARALDALAVRMSRALLPYADGLVRHSELRGKVDGTDLVQDAWLKVMRYLAGPSGDRVQDDTHLLRLIRVAVKSRLLDLLAKPGETQPLDGPSNGGRDSEGDNGESRWERIPDPDDEEGAKKDLGEAIRWGIGDGQYLRLIEALFTSEAEFRRVCQKPPRRKARHYQAYVLCQLEVYLRSETQGGSDNDAAVSAVQEAAALMREYVVTLGVPPAWWQAVEDAGGATIDSGSEEEGPRPEVIAAVNQVCGTNLKDKGTLAVLRYEFNQLLG
jgi:DNA-directed RNA polymerase specialized sigma24 family protein